MCDDHHHFALGRRSFLAGMAGFAAGIDFMSPNGASWSIAGESVTEQKLVPHLV